MKIKKSPKLPDSDLHIIIGVCKANMINFKKIRKPLKYKEPFAAKCKLGWTIFGPDPYIKNTPMLRSNVIWHSNKPFEKKLIIIITIITLTLIIYHLVIFRKMINVVKIPIIWTLQ